MTYIFVSIIVPLFCLFVVLDTSNQIGTMEAGALTPLSQQKINPFCRELNGELGHI